MTNEFSELNLHPQLVQAVVERGYSAPTPIQSAMIPVMLTGRDVIGQAQTGTGKTAAFALPILHTLKPDQNHVQALVLTPTRELAMQVAKAVHAYGRYRGVRVLAVYGGQPYSRQIRRLKNGVDVVVGTPGRLLDLIGKKALDLSRVQTVVLDEADEMLSMGFIEDIETILQETPTVRQTALFSATLSTQIRRLAEQYMTTPQSVTIQQKQLTVAALEQRYYLVNEADKLAALTRLFEVEAISSALIFARTRVGTGELAAALTTLGYPAELLNGDLSQEARERVLNRFRAGQIKVLVATDVAARGLDVDDISHVFNFDLPPDPEIYVHRVGRTGRAGKTGIAISLVTPSEQGRLRRIERTIRQTITLTAVPTAAAIQAYREAQLMEQMQMWLRRGRCQQEQALAAALADDGHDLLQIAAAALKLARAEEKQRPIEPISEVVVRPSRSKWSKGQGRSARRQGNGRATTNGRKQGSRSHEAGMVRLTLNAGKAQGVRPNDVVGTIAYHADIPGRSIGAIQIMEKQTLVDVPQKYAAQVLAKTGSYQIHRQTIQVVQLS